MKLKPKNDRVTLERITVEEKTKSGIILASSDEVKEYYYGKVVAVGRGRNVNGILEPTECKIGDIVLFNPRQSVPFTFEGKVYLTIRDSEISYIIDNMS